MNHRGVWIAPWVGPDGELVAIVMDSRKHLVTEPVTIPHGLDYVALNDQLWQLLDSADPIASTRLGLPPAFHNWPRRRAQRLGIHVLR